MKHNLKVSNIPFINRILYLKNCYQVARGYMGIPRDILQFYLLIALYLHNKGISELIFVPFAILGLIFIFVFGHVIYQKGYIGRENSINTELSNPQLMEIVKNTRELRKKVDSIYKRK